MAAQQIIAIGGGGFSDDRAFGLDRYVLEQTGVSKPAVTFVPTASGDADTYLLKFYRAFSNMSCTPTHLPLFRDVPDVRQHLLEQNVIYVGGGNTKSMLAIWRDWGLHDVLREMLSLGKVLAGLSAGAICWFEQGLSDFRGGLLNSLPCLGFIPGSCCPHYSDEPNRRPRYRELIESREMLPGLAIDDDVAVHLVDGTPHRVVVGRTGSAAYRVALGSDGAIQEDSLSAQHVSVVA